METKGDGDGDRRCALCGIHNPMQKLVVCIHCFHKVMSKVQPVPALFSKWSKQDDAY